MRWSLQFLSAALLAGLSACSGQAIAQPSGATSAAPSRSLQPITIATPSKSLSWFPLQLAVEKGFLRERGLDVTIKQMAPPAQIAALGAGEIDYTTAFGSAIGAAEQGLPIKTVFAICDKPQHVLVATKAINSVKDLKGKTVAITTLGSTVERELTLVLEHDGMAKGDVNVIPLGDSPAIVAAFTAGRIDASVLPVPDNFQAQKEAGTHTLVNIGDVVDAPLSGLSANVKTLQGKPDQVVALLQGTMEGIAYAKAHKDEVVPIIVQFAGVDADTAAQAYDAVRNTWSDSGIVSDDGIRNTIVDPAQATALKPAAVADWSFAKRAKG